MTLEERTAKERGECPADLVADSKLRGEHRQVRVLDPPGTAVPRKRSGCYLLAEFTSALRAASKWIGLGPASPRRVASPAHRRAIRGTAV